MTELTSSRFAPIVEQRLSRVERQLLTGAREGHWWLGVYPLAAAVAPGAAAGASSDPLDWVVAMDAGSSAAAFYEAAQARLQRSKYARAAVAAPGATATFTRNAAADVSLLLAGGRWGAAWAAKRLEGLVTASAEPLGASADSRRLLALPGDWHASLDVQRLYGSVAHGPRGRTIAGVIDRLGLLNLAAASVVGKVDRTQGVSADVDITFGPGEPKGLPAIFGPPSTSVPVPLVGVPSTALGWMRATVRPKRLYEVAELVGNYMASLEVSLVRAHISSIEQSIGKRLGDDILGDEARTWSVYLAQEGDADVAKPVLLAELADASAAASFLAEIAKLLPVLFPDMVVQVAKASDGGPIYSLKRKSEQRELGAWGLRQSTLVVAPTAAMWRAAASVKATAAVVATAVTSGPRAVVPAAPVASGRLGSGALRLLMRAGAPGRAVFAALTGGGAMSEAQVAEMLKGVSFAVSPDGQGFAATVAIGR